MSAKGLRFIPVFPKIVALVFLIILKMSLAKQKDVYDIKSIQERGFARPYFYFIQSLEKK